MRNFFTKLSLAFFASLLFSSTLFAQVGTWTTSGGSSFNEVPGKVVVDDDGFAFALYNYQEDTLWIQDTFVTNAGGFDWAIAKYNPTGDLEWVRRMGGPHDEFMTDLRVSNTGDSIWVVGHFRDTTTIGPKPDGSFWSPHVAFTVLLQFDIIHLVLTKDAELIKWALMDGAGGEFAHSMVKESTPEELYFVTGKYRDLTRAGDFQKYSEGYDDIYIYKYERRAVPFAAAWAGGELYDVSNDIDLWDNDYVIITGYFEDTCYFTLDSSVYVVSEGGRDIFVAAYDSPDDTTLTLAWVKSGGGPLDDEGNSIAFDNDGNMVVTGSFDSTFTWQGTGTPITSNGEYDALMMKLDADGDLMWLQSMGGPGFDAGKDLEVNSANEYVVTGYFQGEIDLGGESVYSNNANDQDAFFAGYSSTGALLWTNSAGGLGVDAGTDVFIGPGDDIWATGTYGDNADFGMSTLTSVGGDDQYLIRMTPLGQVFRDEDLETAGPAITAFPNPAGSSTNIRFDLEENHSITIDLLDMQGNLVRSVLPNNTYGPGVHEVSLNLGNVPSGMYFYRLRTSSTSSTGKLIVLH